MDGDLTHQSFNGYREQTLLKSPKGKSAT